MKLSTTSKYRNGALLALLGILWFAAASAAESYRPFIASDIGGASVAEAAEKAAAALQGGGFEVVGQYAPYDDDKAVVIGFTDDELKKKAASQESGGFAGVLRVAVTDNAGAIEVSYVNPQYVGFAYQVGDLSAVAAKLGAALGKGQAFGAKGLTQSQLDDYHYMMFMPYFKDKRVIAKFSDHAAAVQKVAAALEHADSDMTAVWQVKISDDQTLFGVQLHRGNWEGKIKDVMSKIDVGTPRSTAALPWELLVTGNKLVYLPGKFRIAVMFPDLPMGTFMQISNVPDDMDASAAELGKLAE